MRREERGAGRTTRPGGFKSRPPHQAEDDASAHLRGTTPALPLNPIPGAGGPLLEGGLFHGRVAQWQRGRLISGGIPVRARARPPQPLRHGRLETPSNGKAESTLGSPDRRAHAAHGLGAGIQGPALAGSAPACRTSPGCLRRVTNQVAVMRRSEAKRGPGSSPGNRQGAPAAKGCNCFVDAIISPPPSARQSAAERESPIKAILQGQGYGRFGDSCQFHAAPGRRRGVPPAQAGATPAGRTNALISAHQARKEEGRDVGNGNPDECFPQK